MKERVRGVRIADEVWILMIQKKEEKGISWTMFFKQLLQIEILAKNTQKKRHTQCGLKDK